MNLPATVPELIRQLEEAFPEPRPNPGQSQAEVMYAAGQRSVIHRLHQWQASSVNPVLRQKRGAGRSVPSQDA